MFLKLFNTQTRRCETIVNKKEDSFGVYCCGPTVYGPAHVGNFRTYVVQDTVLRLLKLLGFNVRYVRNLTDVDDKTIRGSIAKHQTLKDYTDHWIQVFEKDCQRLNLLKPTVEPRATETIQAQQDLIQQLIYKDYAYVRGGSVYFRISAFKDYGKLSHLDSRSLQMQALNSAGKANDADEYDREQIADFVLWKAYKPEDGDVFWESPWGKGRPGWHTECSAMSHLYLGSTVDLHSGGIDLCFPHHENEIAQSEAAYGGTFVRHWMHIAHLKVDGQKMSKSLGNLYTLDDLQQKDYDASVVRYSLLTGHYRQTLNFSFDLLQASQSALQKICNYTRQLCEHYQQTGEALEKIVSQVQLTQPCIYLSDFFEAMFDDLNIPKALGCLFSFIHNNRNFDALKPKPFLNEWAACLYALGIPLHSIREENLDIPAEIKLKAEQRWEAKKERRFQEADQLRKEIELLGWNILDQKDSYTLQKLR